MIGWMQRLIERQILKARATGQLENLRGEGAPLADRPEAAFVDAGEAAGFRMMAEAGVLPAEILLKKAVIAQKQRMATISDPEARKVEMAKLSDLMLRQSIAEESRRKFMR
ncbi:DUF1992 domain-containing protein [Oceaniglobus trochenteri]|uniref:DnaJ family domain-containing protein n=1 Tax=Oceaniglobus trochenteri TaxID=2763260 RepID=UPI001CFFD164|nr:DUF1992 domain-containing protein [Oceaniglobus trochenteri]